MKMYKLIPLLFALIVTFSSNAQTLKLDAILDSIRIAHPMLKVYDNEIRAMDEAAKGAKSWMPPQFGLGQFMTPYDVRLWHREGDIPGMGSVMISGEQMFPNKRKLEADEKMMRSMSAVEKEKKNATLNELIVLAKEFYYDWIILKKKLLLLNQNEKLLELMIKNAEIRYQNNLEKIGTYFKAKANLGNLQNMRLMTETTVNERRIQLNTLMGRNSKIYFDIDTIYQMNDYSEFIIDDSFFLQNRSDIKALSREIDLNNLKQESEKQALKPQFGIRFDNMVGFGGQPVQYSIMGMVKFPMAKWSSKMNKATIESLKWKANALQSEKEVMANEYRGMFYEILNEMELKKKQITLYDEKIIPAFRNNFKSMLLSYEQNTEELFMLYDAWEKMNMAQLEYVELVNESLKLHVKLERIIEKK